MTEYHNWPESKHRNNQQERGGAHNCRFFSFIFCAQIMTAVVALAVSATSCKGACLRGHDGVQLQHDQAGTAL